MGKLINLLKDVIVDSTQNRNQGQQGRFNNSDLYSPRSQSQQYSYNWNEDYGYRGANQRSFDDRRSRPVYSLDSYGRHQRGNDNKPLSPSAYVSSYGGGTSLIDPRSLEDGRIYRDSRPMGPATRVSDELPQSDLSDSFQPQPPNRDDTAPPTQISSSYTSSREGYGPQTQGPSYVDDLDNGPDYSLRGPAARTLRGSAPQRQYGQESFTDRSYSSELHYGSRRDRRRTRRSDRRASKSTSRQGIVSLLKDSIVSSANSRAPGGR